MTPSPATFAAWRAERVVGTRTVRTPSAVFWRDFVVWRRARDPYAPELTRGEFLAALTASGVKPLNRRLRTGGRLRKPTL